MKYLATILTAFFLCNSAYSQVAVGERAPNFEHQVLGEEEGVTISLTRDLEDKVVYIFFYGASCPHCISNGPVTETEIYDSFKNDTNFVALGLDTWNQGVSNNNNFRNSTGISYPLLLNAQSTLIAYYGGTGFYDRSIVIGADGFLRYKGTGYVNTDYQAVIQKITEELEKLSTGAEPGSDTPSVVILNQNYPNPFNPATTISYVLSKPAFIQLQIYNATGQKLTELISGLQNTGEHRVIWDASGYPSGVYFYQLSTGFESLTGKMLLLK